jgi:hypothetical protein
VASIGDAAAEFRVVSVHVIEVDTVAFARLGGDQNRVFPRDNRRALRVTGTWRPYVSLAMLMIGSNGIPPERILVPI